MTEILFDEGVLNLGCDIKILEKPKLKNPILIEGLPGIGLVANIAIAFLIKKLEAKILGEIRSPAFPEISVVEKTGILKPPFCRLYYYKGRRDEERDLILLYGNTQALTRRGQYELCGVILDVSEIFGCKYVITLGGYRPGKRVERPNLYYAASDPETARTAASLGAEILGGQIYGVAGLLIGLAALRGMQGFCLLAETSGDRLDVVAAREVLKAISGFLGLRLDLEELKDSEGLADFLVPFDFGVLARERMRKISRPRPKWFV